MSSLIPANNAIKEKNMESKWKFFKQSWKSVSVFMLSTSLVCGMMQLPENRLMEQIPKKVMAKSSSTQDDWLHTDGADIVDKNGNVVRLTGANWFGFNCSECMLHGLGWGADIRKVIKGCADKGINILRIPVSTELLLSWKKGKPMGQATNFSNTAYYKDNPDLVNADGTSMNSWQVFDKMMEICKEYGVKVMVDVHSADANNSGHNYPLWYGPNGITTKDWIAGWTWLVKQYVNDDTLIACDLKNEPHGKRDEENFAKWDNSKDKNNWKYAAEQCANAILAINPNLLIMIEGVEQNPTGGYSYKAEAKKDANGYLNYEGAWWGGNLRLVKQLPIKLEKTKWNQQIVYSPHDYGPAVYAQPWFEKNFTKKSLLKDYWYDAWAYLVEEDRSPLLIGEWGGYMDNGKNEKWMKLLAEYMNEKNISHTFWCINPNSGDTGGLLQSDWKTWDLEKYKLLKKTLWQDKDGQYIGLDHQKALGKNGISTNEYFNSNPVGSSANLTTNKLAKVTGLKKKKVNRNSIKLVWKKQKKVTGYQVYKYNAKKKKYVLYKTTKKNAITIKGLKKNTTYKVKVRAYKGKKSARTYGKFSAVLKVKTKK